MYIYYYVMLKSLNNPVDMSVVRSFDLFDSLTNALAIIDITSFCATILS